LTFVFKFVLNTVQKEALEAKMPFDFEAVVTKNYSVSPVPPTFITSKRVPKAQILWIGCSDSLICETETLSVLPDEIFVHRNLGNIISNEDLSSKSAVEYCADLLQVDHIVVCGHYDCVLMKEIGVDSRGDRKGLGGWYKDLTKLYKIYSAFLENSGGAEKMDERNRDRRFEEIYVLAEVEWLGKQPNVKKAMEERRLQIHAFVYDRERNACMRLIEKGDNSLGI